MPLPPNQPLRANRLAERRRLLEQVRTVSVSRVRSDLDEIVKRESAFAKQLVQQLVPVRLVWNDGSAVDLSEAMSRLLPFRFEVTDVLDEGVHRTVPPEDEDDGNVVDKPIA
jgi:hypothetical protein